MRLDEIKKVFACEIKQIGEESERTLRFIGSDETPDRDDDIIEVNGWKTNEYMKNPVFLWAHNYDMPPIGKTVKLEKDLARKRLMFDIKFPTLQELSSDIENPSEHAKFVDTIYNLYKGGYLSATSVGFRGVKFKRRDDEMAMSEHPDNEYRRGRRYMEQNLLEISGVPVPSNPSALQQAKSAGIDIENVKKMIEDQPPDIPIVIVETETHETETWKCPHCQNNIGEKELYHDGNKFFHSPCKDAGAILLPEKDCEEVKANLLKPPEVKEFKEVELLVDSEAKEVFVSENGQKTAKVKISEECLEKLLHPLEKAGATISAKNRAKIEEAMGHMQMAMDAMKEMAAMPEEEMPMMTADMTMPIMEMPMMEPMMSAMRTAIAEEIKTALEDIKSQVLFVAPKKDAPKVIDLDAIEFPETKKDVAQIELDFKPDELKNMIKEIIQNSIQGGK